MKRVALTLLCCFVLVGCGSAPATHTETLPPGTTVTATYAPKQPNPNQVTIPAIGVSGPLIDLGLNAKGELEVPDVTKPQLIGWYAKGGIPGESGFPAVVAAHVDGQVNGKKGQPGAFFRLHELKPGDRIDVGRVDKTNLTFTVYKVDKVSKSAFPTAAVYGGTVEPELRLITCGGAFDRTAGSYVDNWVVYARVENA